MTHTDAAGTQTIGFRTLGEEVTRDDLPIEGCLPDWLTGELVRVTPAGLDSNGHSVRHWFDGLAMLHKFSFQDGRVSYANRYLDTEARRRAADPGARLLVLDATTFTELARAQAPHAVPFGFHGQYFS